MAEQMTNLEAAARAIWHRDMRIVQPGAPEIVWRIQRDSYMDQARAALTAIGMTEAQQMMPVGSLVIVPDDVAKRRAEHAARVADAYDRIRSAGRPAASTGSEG